MKTILLVIIGLIIGWVIKSAIRDFKKDKDLTFYEWITMFFKRIKNFLKKKK